MKKQQTHWRWCLPVVSGRGAGLGNELVPWARAFLMSRAIGANCLPPAFGMNSRGYGRHFGTSDLDWLWHRVIARGLPHLNFEETDYLAHADASGDVGVAFAKFAQAQGLERRAPLIVLTSGLWGGMHHVARAREFVRATLYASRYARANLAELSARLDPAKLTIAMHVRLGDFANPPPSLSSYRGHFNVALPMAWFMRLGEQLRQAMGDRVQFQLYSDGSPAQLAPLVQLVQPVSTSCVLPADVSDLLAMSQADLLICSVSSYSVWAANLSDAPYVWFKPQMTSHAQDLLSVWGHEHEQAKDGSFTQLAFAAEQALSPPERIGRCHAIGLDESLPSALIEHLCSLVHIRRRTADPLRYGVTRQPRP